MRKKIWKVIWFGKKCIARGGGWWKRDQKKIHRWLFISGNGRSGRSGVRVDNASYWSRCFCGAYCFPISRINQYIQTDRVTWTRDYYWQMHSFDKRAALARLRFQCRRSRFAILLNRPLLPRYLLLALSDFPVFEYSRQSVHWLTRAVKNNDESVSSTRLVSPQFFNAGFSSVDCDNVLIVERNKIDWNNIRTKMLETGLTRSLEIHAALYKLS